MNIPHRIPEPVFADDESTKRYIKSSQLKKKGSYSYSMNFLKKSLGNIPKVAIDICGADGNFLHSLHGEFNLNKGVLFDKSSFAISQFEKENTDPRLKTVTDDVYNIKKYQELKGQFDLVSIVDALHELNDLDAVLEQALFLLKDEGHLYIKDFNRINLASTYYSQKKGYKRILAKRKRLEQTNNPKENLDSDIDLFWYSIQASYTDTEIENSLKKKKLDLISTDDQTPFTLYLARKKALTQYFTFLKDS